MMKNIPIIDGEKYTLYKISDAAVTQRKEIIVTDVFEHPLYKKRYEYEVKSLSSRWEIGAYREYRKRNQYYLTIRPDRDLIRDL